MFLQLVFLLVAGLVFGSFVSALTYRYPRGLSVVKGRSFCPKCKRQIAWLDNIPLLSFLILGGKCRDCRKKISWRYPVVEFATAMGFVIIGYFATTLQGGSFKGVTLFYSLAIFIILISIFIVDLEHRIIPDDFVFWGIFISVVYSLFIIPDSLFTSFLAGFLSGLLLLIIFLLTKGRGMGLGDVKFAVLGGLIIGIKLFYVWLMLAFLTGGATGIILILVRKARFKSKIAFGPFLIVGLGLAILFGNAILKIIGI
jgi:leader peptidase (prepilin peptidase)/N-methyltransferase